MMGPVITPPRGPLERALTTLDPGESWLVEPRPLGDDGRLWSPGVRIGVQPGSWFHRTECFGPVLGVIRADDLDHAVDIQNAVAYGLTGGLHSLDEAEIERWLERVEVGNAYVNRHTTGRHRAAPAVRRVEALVGGSRRQDRRARATSTGSSRSAASAVHRRSTTPRRRTAGRGPSSSAGRSTAAGCAASATCCATARCGTVIVRAGADTPAADLASLRVAAEVAGVAMVVAEPSEDDAALAARLPTSGAARLRLLAAVDDAVLVACHDAGIAVDRTPVTHDGRVELPCWLREQSISWTLHRHGRIPGHHGQP